MSAVASPLLAVPHAAGRRGSRESSRPLEAGSEGRGFTSGESGHRRLCGTAGTRGHLRHAPPGSPCSPPPRNAHHHPTASGASASISWRFPGGSAHVGVQLTAVPLVFLGSAQASLQTCSDPVSVLPVSVWLLLSLSAWALGCRLRSGLQTRCPHVGVGGGGLTGAQSPCPSDGSLTGWEVLTRGPD